MCTDSMMMDHWKHLNYVSGSEHEELLAEETVWVGGHVDIRREKRKKMTAMGRSKGKQPSTPLHPSNFAHGREVI